MTEYEGSIVEGRGEGCIVLALLHLKVLVSS